MAACKILGPTQYCIEREGKLAKDRLATRVSTKQRLQIGRLAASPSQMCREGRLAASLLVE